MPKPLTFSQRFQRLLLTGLLTLLPLWLTWVVVKFVFVLLGGLSKPLVEPGLQGIAAGNPRTFGWLVEPWVQNAIALAATVGFILLTATLLTGVLFVENFLVQKLTHKTVLSVLSWLTFGALLIGRWRYGWRGAKAVHWTLTAMVLLLLAFFGSKFVYEMVLRRS